MKQDKKNKLTNNSILGRSTEPSPDNTNSTNSDDSNLQNKNKNNNELNGEDGKEDPRSANKTETTNTKNPTKSTVIQITPTQTSTPIPTQTSIPRRENALGNTKTIDPDPQVTLNGIEANIIKKIQTTTSPSLETDLNSLTITTNNKMLTKDPSTSIFSGNLDVANTTLSYSVTTNDFKIQATSKTTANIVNKFLSKNSDLALVEATNTEAIIEEENGNKILLTEPPPPQHIRITLPISPTIPIPPTIPQKCPDKIVIQINDEEYIELNINAKTLLSTNIEIQTLNGTYGTKIIHDPNCIPSLRTTTTALDVKEPNRCKMKFK